MLKRIMSSLPITFARLFVVFTILVPVALVAFIAYYFYWSLFIST